MRYTLLLLSIMACAGCSAVAPVDMAAGQKNCNIFISQDEMHEGSYIRKFPEDTAPFLEPARRILEAKGYTLVDDCKLASMEIYGVGLFMKHGEYYSRLTVSRIVDCREITSEDFLFESAYEYDRFSRWLNNAFTKLFDDLDKKFPTCEAQTFKAPERPWF